MGTFTFNSAGGWATNGSNNIYKIGHICILHLTARNGNSKLIATISSGFRPKTGFWHHTASYGADTNYILSFATNGQINIEYPTSNYSGNFFDIIVYPCD